MKTILIANRGEIALRIVRACRDLGLRSVAVYADADADALHVRGADEAYALPGATPAETYLNIPALLEIAQRAGADAVHPGYGFLSERAEFAAAVAAAGLVWIGPDADVIAALGDKVSARAIAMKVGAPLVPGTPGPVSGPDEVRAFAEAHGLPVAIKAAFGGGGRGLKVARRADEIEDLYFSAVREAETAFGNGACYAERFLERPRHVEAQVVADRHGNVVVVGTRDCSLQRRNQKLVEEAPAPFLTDEQRARIEDASRAICREAGYTGAGTVEFLLGSDGMISFLEVNTRLQVEHPVTEETAGIDLVAEQFRIAQGLPLSIDATPAPVGHSIEFRINAEDPGRGFLPTPGRITRFRAPSGPGVRVDSGVEEGSAVPPTFDSLMAKLIVTGPTRAVAIARARRALAEFEIEGPASVLPFHRAVLAEPAFTDPARFSVHTGWIENDFASGLEAHLRVVAAERTVLRGPVEIDGKRHDIGFTDALIERLAQRLGGRVSSAAPAAKTAPAAAREPGNAILAPIAGKLVNWMVADGEPVEAGQPVAVMEAMKMETVVTAPAAGTLHIAVQPGAAVTSDMRIGSVE